MECALASYNQVLLQIAILLGIVCAIVVMTTITIKYIRKALRKVQATYAQNEADAKKGKKTKTPNYVIISLVTAAIIACVFIVFVIVANKEWGFALSSNNVVLTFVGILATFIVITNYAQVSDIKHEVDSKLLQLQREHDSFVRKVMKELKKNKNNRKNKEKENG
ncbi:MAG: hypothetical protein IJS82_06780 [Paludibacteraceae bacterium]|nr:hypothetical protein [Paludibacteraceae bacterium]